TLGCYTYNIKFMTNFGPVNMTIWDTAGQEVIGYLRDSFYLHTDYAVAMMDITMRSCLTKISNTWIQPLLRVSDQAKVIVAANKTDLPKENHK
ncbi:MAG: hypothetical protein MHPSP_004684, partial [Paramarteilia canceri]